MGSEPAVRPLRDADVTAVRALLAAEWPLVDWERHFARAWRDNPAANDASLPRGFVCEAGPDLLGFFGSIPVRYQIAGRPGLACIATALCVRTSARHRGAGKALVAAFDAQRCDLRINATPNAESAPLFARLGYVRIVPADGRHTLAHARQPLGSLRKAWRARGRGFLRALVSSMQPPRAVAPQLACSVLREATGELDTLWSSQRAVHPTTMWRDRTALQWLLFADARTTVFGARDAQGALRGYAAFRVDRGELRQIDAFPAHDVDALVSLALAGAQHAESLGIATVRLLSVPANANGALVARGFEPVATDHALLVRGATPDGTWFTAIDGDAWL